MKSGSADLPLHGGHCPPWLFEQMKTLGVSIVEALILEFSRREVIRRFSDPGWFQTLGCVLGFDWHSSGVTTVVCGALKEALNERTDELGLYLAGGKGAASRKTPRELEEFVDDHAPELPVDDLIQSSRMTAQVDSSAVQDGYQIYHHSFLLNTDGEWTVIQQGLREETGWARRYHWWAESSGDFLDDPHEAVCSDQQSRTLNLADAESESNRETSAEMVREDPAGTLREYVRLLDYWNDTSRKLELPDRHSLPEKKSLERNLGKLYDRPPEDFSQLIDTDGVGPKTTRALSMVAEVVWGADPSYEDPARYAFAHGGKDGYPYPVDRSSYETTISVLNDAIRRSKLGDDAKLKAFERLGRIESTGRNSEGPSGPRQLRRASPGNENTGHEQTDDDQLTLDFQ